MQTLAFCLLLVFFAVKPPAKPQALTTKAPGHVFEYGSVIRLTSNGLADQPGLSIRLSSSLGSVIRTMDAKIDRSELDLGTLEPGWYHIDAIAGGKVVTSCDLAVVRKRKVSGFRPDSPFGLTAPAKSTDEWNLLGDAGISWIQWSVPWAYLEEKPGLLWYMPGAHKYDDHEGYVDECNKRGIRVVLQFRTVPKWANSGAIGSYVGTERSELHPPDDNHWDKYEAFIGAVVDRFKAKGVHDYEVWSESDGSLFKRFDTHRFPKIEAYQKLVSHAKTAIKSKDPGARLMAPGDEPVELLRQIEQGHQADAAGPQATTYAGKTLNGDGKLSDIVSGHFYWTDWQSIPRRYWPPDDDNPGRRPTNLKQMIDDARSLAEGRPVWITEVGYGSAKSTETPDEMSAGEDGQASLLVRYFVLTQAWGIQKVFWYTWKDNSETSYGLLRADGTVKPSYVAYRTMTERLEGQRFDRMIKAGSDRYIAKFVGSKTIFVVWTNRKDEEMTMDVPWPQVRVTARDGAEHTSLSEKGKIKLNLRKGEPIYLDQQE